MLMMIISFSCGGLVFILMLISRLISVARGRAKMPTFNELIIDLGIMICICALGYTFAEMAQFLLR